MNNKKITITFILIATLSLLGMIGFTIAYFTSSTDFENEFQTGLYQTEATETFVSPESWMPGDTTPKTLTITNTGTVDAKARVCLTEEWTSGNDDVLPLTQNGESVAIINLANTSDWTKQGDCYEYNDVLEPNDTTSSFIESVTFNPNAEADLNCTTTTSNGTTTKECSSTGDGYDNATYKLTLTAETVQANKADNLWNPDNGTLYGIVKNEYMSGNGYVGLYTGAHNDSYTIPASKNIYYYTTEIEDDETQGNILLEKINVIFAGYCWQMFRTTDTGGVKMIYNGIPVDGKCLNTRDNQTIIRQQSRTTEYMNGSFAFGSDFTYDISTKTFKLAGTIKENINFSYNKSVIGMYTCKESNKDATCSKLYFLDEEIDSIIYVYPIEINRGNYSLTGFTQFNAEDLSPAYVGYMYNKVYTRKNVNSNTINKYGSSVTWNGTKYILNNILEIDSGTRPTMSDISTHHYFCLNNNTSCTSVAYAYYYSSTLLYYILLENGVNTVEKALNEMLYDDNVNSKNSAVKRIIDEWYYNNLLEYDSYLEETIYCNDRSIINMFGWKEDNEILNDNLQFKEYNKTTDLSCTNETDKFSISNNKAKLRYKIGLASGPEMNLIKNSIARKTGRTYILGSPYYFTGSVNTLNIGTLGNLTYNNIGILNGARGVISLKYGISPSSGSGTMADPYVIDTSGV